MSRSFPLFSIVSACALLFSACNQDPAPRRYREIALRAADGSFQGEAPVKLSWSLPDGWLAQPEGDPLRMAGFWAPDPALAHTGEMDPRAVDVSLVQLAGDGGGLDANVVRWLGQAGIPASFAEQVIASAPAVRAATGQHGIVVDFTGLLAGDLTRSQSIVGAIFPGSGYTVFVKASGDRDRLEKIKPQLLEFCRGLSITEESR